MEQGDGSFSSLCRKEMAASLRLMVETLAPPVVGIDPLNS